MLNPADLEGLYSIYQGLVQAGEFVGAFKDFVYEAGYQRRHRKRKAEAVPLSTFDINNGEPKLTKTETIMSMGPHHELATDGMRGKFVSSKSSIGRKKKKTLAKAWEALALNTKYVICRWQSLSTTNFAVGVGTQMLTNYRDVTGNTLYLPMYAFNLSTVGSGYFNNGATLAYTAPMYRLCKVIGAAASTRQYVWQQAAGYRNGPLGDAASRYVWQVEDRNTTPARTKVVTHAWTDVKTVLYGARNRTHHVHMDVVQFPDEAAPVRRFSTDPTTVNLPIDYDPEIAAGSEDVSGVDLWWDHWWATKVGNPIRTSKYSGNAKPVNWLKNSTCILNNDVSTDNDQAPFRVVKEMFMREDKSFKTVDDKNIEATRAQVVVSIDQVPAYDDSGVANETNIFNKREKDKWLLVYSDTCFDQTSTAQTFVDPGTASLYWPSFDINVRGKWLFTN